MSCMGGEAVQKELGIWLRTWEMLPGELQAFVLLVACVIGITWFARETRFTHMTKKKRTPMIFTVAFCTGLVGGALTWYFDDSIGIGAAIMLSVLSGPVAILVHHLFINVIMARLKKQNPANQL